MPAIPIIFFVPVLLARQNASHPIASGTVNGQPIPAKVFSDMHEGAFGEFVFKHEHEPASAADQHEINTIAQRMECDRLKGAIGQAARDAVAHQLNVVVTQQDIDEARQSNHPVDPAVNSGWLTSQAKAVLTALSAVLDKHEDPDTVYEQTLKKVGFPRSVLTALLHAARTPEGRQAVEKRYRGNLAFTPAVVAKAATDPRYWTGLAKQMKLDAAVDQEIAAGDPTFKTYLNEYLTTQKSIQRPASDHGTFPRTICSI